MDFGIEEELMLVDANNNLVKKSGDVITRINRELAIKPLMELNASKLLWKVNQEPCTEQIEYSTRPMARKYIREAMCFGRKLLSHGARWEGLVATNNPLYIFYTSVHPQSNPNPMCGVHVHISVPNMDYVVTRRIYNKLWNFLPELIGLTKVTDRLNKSKVLGFAPYFEKLYTIPLQKLKEKDTYWGKRLSLFVGIPKDVQVLSSNRMTDMSIRGKYYYDECDHKYNKVEVRIFDVHKNLDFVNGYLEIIEGLVLDAVNNGQEERKKRMKYYRMALKYPNDQNRYLNRSINNLIRRYVSEPDDFLRLRGKIQKAQEMGTTQNIRRDDTRRGDEILGRFRVVHGENPCHNLAGSTGTTYNWHNENISTDD